MKNFNPCDMYFSEETTIFGLPVSFEESALILLGVPWDLTCSFRTGTAEAPTKIFDLSFQIDLYNKDFPDVWKKGIFFEDSLMHNISRINREYKPLVEKYRQKLYKGEKSLSLAAQINSSIFAVFEEIQSKIKTILSGKKCLGVLGGEHGITYNPVKMLGEIYSGFSVIQIDAHADLRESYEGLEFSHASVMYNILRDVPAVKRIVNLGVRDYSHCEAERIRNDERIYAPDFFAVRERQFQGTSWEKITEEFIAEIPTEKIYITLDMDGLDVPYCTGTGTPVPGGLSFAETKFFLKKLVEAKKQIIGFDLVEVAGSDDNELNYINATHLLYYLSLLALSTA